MNAFTWAARILAALIIGFFSLFAVPTGLNGSGPDAPAIDVLMNLLPALICLAALLVAWRNERLGGGLFIALALGYTVWNRDRLDWSLVVGGPLLLTGVLFLLSARTRKQV